MTKPREEFFINSAIEGLFGFLNQKNSSSINSTSNSNAKPSSTRVSGENRNDIKYSSRPNWCQALGIGQNNNESPTTNPTPAPKTNLDNQCDLFSFLGTIFNLCQPEAKKPSTTINRTDKDIQITRITPIPNKTRWM
jgi:hypothetical protein